MKASCHFKAYIYPCLRSLANSKLCFQLGPINVNNVCVSDYNYLLSDSPSCLQVAINIVAHDANRIHLTFDAAKKTITISGSKQDMEFYCSNVPWKLNGERLKVVDDNDHLGLIVSGSDEEQNKLVMSWATPEFSVG